MLRCLNSAYESRQTTHYHGRDIPDCISKVKHNLSKQHNCPINFKQPWWPCKWVDRLRQETHIAMILCLPIWLKNSAYRKPIIPQEKWFISLQEIVGHRYCDTILTAHAKLGWLCVNMFTCWVLFRTTEHHTSPSMPGNRATHSIWCKTQRCAQKGMRYNFPFETQVWWFMNFLQHLCL